MAVGGTTLSAGLADAQAQLASWAAGGSGPDSISQAADAYRASGGGPTLALLGFNPFQIVATGSFHALYWGLVVIFLGIMAVTAMQQSLRGRQTMTARHPLAALAQVNFRLLLGVVLMANTPLVYGLLMTVNTAVSTAVQAMSDQALGHLLQAGGMGPLTFAAARADAIRDAAARRAIALHPAGASRAEMTQLGEWYNALAGAINAALEGCAQPGQLPLLDSSRWTDGTFPDDRLAAAVGRTLVQNFGALVAALGALPPTTGPLTIGFPAGQSTRLVLLASALAPDDAQAAETLALPALPSSTAAFEAGRQRYAKAVLSDTLAYLDDQLLPVLGSSPTLAQRARAWFSDQVERAAAGAGGWLSPVRGIVDWVGRSFGVVLTRMVAFMFTAAVKVMIEVDLFLLVIAMPFWLMPATEEAFYGVLRSLGWLTVIVPAYQFIMLFVDALMALVLRYLLLGPAAAAGAGWEQAAGGAAYGTTAAMAVAATGGEVAALALLCYLVTYLFLATYVALKTPKLVAAFLKGAGAAGAFLSTFATGLIAGASTALATAAVGGSGSAGRWLAAGGSPRGAPTPAAPPVAGRAPGSGPAAPHRPQFGRVTAQHPPRAAAPPWKETVRFGVRTFFENLESTSPADGLATARKAWERQQKLREKEDDARQKLEAKAEKAAAPPAARKVGSGQKASRPRP
jgi:hypothetical protein